MLVRLVLFFMNNSLVFKRILEFCFLFIIFLITIGIAICDGCFPALNMIFLRNKNVATVNNVSIDNYDTFASHP